MKTTSVFLVVVCFLLTTTTFSQDHPSCAIPNPASRINIEDVTEALKLLGVELYKYSITSSDALKFNILFQEYLNGKCIDSSFLLGENKIKSAERTIWKPLIISKDTNYLRIYCQKETDSTFLLDAAYSFFSFGSMQKSINVPLSKFGRHIFYSFGSPKINGRGLYKVLAFTPTCKQVFGNQTIEYLSFSDNIVEMSSLVKHFYLISVVAK